MGDVRDRLEAIVSNGEVTRRAGGVKDDGGRTLVRRGASWKSTRGRRGRSEAGDGEFAWRGSRVAGDGVSDGCCIDGGGPKGSGSWVDT